MKLLYPWKYENMQKPIMLENPLILPGKNTKKNTRPALYHVSCPPEEFGAKGILANNGPHICLNQYRLGFMQNMYGRS